MKSTFFFVSLFVCATVCAQDVKVSGPKKQENISKPQIKKQQNKQNQRISNADVDLYMQKGDEYYFGANTNFTEAAKWYSKAAELGNAQAQFYLGWMYIAGEGVSVDSNKGLNLIRKAAEQGEMRAQMQLGALYNEGKIVNKDLNKSFYWTKKSAEQGYDQGIFNLGMCYENGWGTTADLILAEYWYKKAANQGYADAQFKLALMYISGGNGIKENYTQAISYLRILVNKNYPYAFSVLGYLYENAIGIERDELEALKLYEKAANLGDETAKKQMERLLNVAKVRSAKNNGGKHINVTNSQTMNTSLHQWNLLSIQLQNNQTVLTKKVTPKQSNTMVFSEGNEYIQDADTGIKYYIENSEIGKRENAKVLKGTESCEYLEIYPKLPSNVKRINVYSGNGFFVTNFKIR